MDHAANGQDQVSRAIPINQIAQVNVKNGPVINTPSTWTSHFSPENNDRPFEKATRSGRTMKTVNSQDKFFQILTPQRLKELLCRFDSGLIVKHINDARSSVSDLNKTIKVKSEWVRKRNSIYIDYLLGNKRVFHFSIHLYPILKNSRTNGPIHFKVNTGNDDINQKTSHKPVIVFNVSHNISANRPYMRELTVLRTVLNAYFDKRHPYYLENSLCSSSAVNNATVKRMYSNIQGILARSAATRRLSRNSRHSQLGRQHF
jgi:hypothetical protein